MKIGPTFMVRPSFHVFFSLLFLKLRDEDTRTVATQSHIGHIVDVPTSKVGLATPTKW